MNYLLLSPHGLQERLGFKVYCPTAVLCQGKQTLCLHFPGLFALGRSRCTTCIISEPFLPQMVSTAVCPQESDHLSGRMESLEAAVCAYSCLAHDRGILRETVNWPGDKHHSLWLLPLPCSFSCTFLALF